MFAISKALLWIQGNAGIGNAPMYYINGFFFDRIRKNI